MMSAPDSKRLTFLEQLLCTDAPSWCHWSSFLVAEIEDQPAAAISGFAEHAPGRLIPPEAIHIAGTSIGWSEAELDAGYERLAPYFTCLIESAQNAWTVEWVATVVEYRGRGLALALLHTALDLGRDQGHDAAQITLVIDNQPARRVYERAGFHVATEKRHPAFQAALGSPGLLRMNCPL